MRTDRRGFFKFGAGAAVAAPVAMKQAVADVGMPPLPNGFAGAGAIGAETASGIKAEITRYAKSIADLDRPRQRHERLLEPIIAEQIDGLRSVSPVNRARMMSEAREELQRLRERGWMQRAIDNLKERLGPLGGVF
jgi:hypothetical protein